jgi:hypothetical protein
MLSLKFYFYQYTVAIQLVHNRDSGTRTLLTIRFTYRKVQRYTIHLWLDFQGRPP